MSNLIGSGDIYLIVCAVCVYMKCVLIKDGPESPVLSRNQSTNGEYLINCAHFRKPLPLTTVELQKQGARFLRMSSAQIMKVLNLGVLADFRLPRSCIPRALSPIPGRRRISLIQAWILEFWWGNRLSTTIGDNTLNSSGT